MEVALFLPYESEICGVEIDVGRYFPEKKFGCQE
jgi:hypothetical protein